MNPRFIRPFFLVFAIAGLFIVLNACFSLLVSNTSKKALSVSDVQFPQCCSPQNLFAFPSQSPPLSLCVYPESEDLYVSGPTHTANGDVDKLFEASIRNSMIEVLKENGDSNAVVLDIGANIGLHAVFLGNQGYEVHAFEPMKANFDKLACSAASNSLLRSKVKANNFGLATEPKTDCIEADPENRGNAVIQSKKGAICAPENVIRVERLDKYLDQHKIKPFLIKIDTEGYEGRALYPAKHHFQKSPPKHIFTEFCPRHFRDLGEDPQEYLDFFYNLGYKLETASIRVTHYQYDEYGNVDRGSWVYQELLNRDLADLHFVQP